MNKFDEWWEVIERGLIAAGRDNPYVLAALRAVANEAYNLAQPQWQPLETAPKDGTQFLLKVGPVVLIGRYADGSLIISGDLPKGEHKWYWARMPEVAEREGGKDENAATFQSDFSGTDGAPLTTGQHQQDWARVPLCRARFNRQNLQQHTSIEYRLCP